MVWKPFKIEGSVFKIARRYSSENSRKIILSTCVRLFIEKGYNHTTVAEILKDANVSSSTFQNIFRSKDGVLEDLVKFMFQNQFSMARQNVGEGISPVFMYAVEVAIQLTLTEVNENLRDVYVEAYTYPKTLEYICQHTSSELYEVFKEYSPEFKESDFYESEVGMSGAMRNYMAKPCDKYFTLEGKIKRVLTMLMSIYNVPKAEMAKVLEYVAGTDVVKVANEVMQELFKALAMEFEFEL